MELFKLCIIALPNGYTLCSSFHTRVLTLGKRLNMATILIGFNRQKSLKNLIKLGRLFKSHAVLLKPTGCTLVGQSKVFLVAFFHTILGFCSFF
jgi:hypothetical protein